MGRAAVAGTLGLVAGFVLGLAVRGCAATAPEERPARPSPAAVPDRPTPSASRPSRRGRPARGNAPDETGPAGAADASNPTSDGTAALGADVRVVPVEGTPTGWGDLDVDFVNSDGTPIGGQGFNIAPCVAGVTRVDMNGMTFHTQTDPGGRARFRVATPGRYDVWTTSGMAQLLVRGVDVPATGPVRFVKPPFADVTVAMEDGAATAESEIRVKIESAGSEEVAWQGAALVPVGAWIVPIKAAGPAAEYSLVAPMRWRVRAPAGFVAVPAAVRPPAQVVVRRSGGAAATLEVRWRVAIAAAAPPFGEVRFDRWLDGGAVEHESFSIDSSSWADGVVSMDLTIPFVAPNGVLHWSGPDVEPGSLPYDLAVSRTVTPRLTATSSTVVRVDVEPSDEPDPSVVPVALAIPGDTDGPEREELSPGVDAAVAGARWIVALGSRRPDETVDDRVAGPLLLRGGARHVLRYRRGGYVVVVPRSRLPANSGDVEIARADGGPIVFTDSEGERQAGSFAPIVAGTVLGPFEPGTTTLDLLVGRVRWARYEVTIRAGEDTTLPVGPLPK